MLTVEWPRARRIKALALVLILSVFAFAAAVHSVHHLSHLNQAIQCGIALASGNLAGTAVASMILDKPTLAFELVSEVGPIDPSTACSIPAHGRAPPFHLT